MKKRLLLRRVFISYLLVVGSLAGLLLAMLRSAMLDEAIDRERDLLLASARAHVAVLDREAALGNQSAASLAIVPGRHEERLAIAAFGADGMLLASSNPDFGRADRAVSPAEVVAARTADHGWSLRQSGGAETLNVAVMADSGAGFVRASMPTSEIRAAALDRWAGRARLVAVAAALASALGFVFAWRFAQPIEMLRRGAERFGRGDLKRKVPVPPGVEIAELAEALNRMAAQLDLRITELERERNGRTAILESLDEGVVAVDSSERVLWFNFAAGELLGIGSRDTAGRLVQEVCRNVELQRHIARALEGDFSFEEDQGSTFRVGRGEKMLRCRCAPLRDGEDSAIGVVAILTDVTRLQRLENLRRDFVANVSHELRTPITSIKGFTETLLDDGLEDPVQARRFLEVVSRQADRLGSVIEDLLSLSRLDRRDGIEKRECSLARLLQDAAELCRAGAARQSVEIVVECPDGLLLQANSGLVEQAVANLIDNAVKYGGPGKRVQVVGETDGPSARIRVRDQGPGIDKEHQERIFERFYRVDKARSRDVGGTGLGLSIVKNVAQAHGGAVSVSSVAGAGSEFALTLPLATAGAPIAAGGEQT